MKDFLKKHKGQVTLSTLLGIGVSILIAAAGSFSASVNHTDGKIEGLRSTNESTLQRVATVEAENKEVSRRLDSIEKKIDLLLTRQPLNGNGR